MNRDEVQKYFDSVYRECKFVVTDGPEESMLVTGSFSFTLNKGDPTAFTIEKRIAECLK